MKINLQHTRAVLSNLSAALFLNMHFLKMIVQVYVPSIEKYGLPVLFMVSLLLAAVSIRRIRVRVSHFVIPAVVILYFLVTGFLFPRKSATDINDVLRYVLFPFIFIWLEPDFEKIVKYSLIITSPAIICLHRVFVQFNEVKIGMDVSFAALPSVIFAVTYLVYYMRINHKHRLFYLILCAIHAVFFYEMVFFGSRGPTLSVLVFLFILVFFRRSGKEDKVVSHGMKLFAVLSVLFMIVILFGDYIVNNLDETLARLGINIRFITKSIKLIQESNVTHGRLEYYRLALAGFLDKPLLGNGFDMFLANTGLVYPHNLILQFAYDGGLMMLAGIVFPVVLLSIVILSSKKYSTFICWASLFCASVPGAMVSGDIWKKYTFWMFAAYCLSYGWKRREELSLARLLNLPE